MQEIHKERLLKLADFLETVPESKFDLTSFVSFPDNAPEICTDEKATEFFVNKLTDHTCGTTACALGYCPLAFPGEWVFDHWGLPHEVGCQNSRNGHDFFGILRPQWAYLFDGDNERTPAEEVAVIREFVASNGAVPREY